MKAVTVYMIDVQDGGRLLGGMNTTAKSLYGAVRNAYEFFHDPFWKGFKPTMKTVFRVQEHSDHAWFIRASAAFEGKDSQAERNQQDLFATPDPL